MFCVSIEGILNTVLKNKEVVLCRETAAAYLGLSNGWGIPLKFYTRNKNIINSTYIKGYIIEDFSKIETIRLNNVVCTSEKQTIIDLIRYKSSAQEILESLANYYYKHDKNIDLLYRKAESEGLRKRLDSYVEDAKEYYNEG